MNLYFNEPRLKLSAFGDFWVRITTYSAYLITAAGIPILVTSDMVRLRWLGLLIALFLGDRLLHLGQAEKSLTELARSKRKEENVVLYMTPAAKKILDYSYRKARVLGQNFHLVLLKELLGHADVKEILRRLEINRNEFEQKIDEYLNLAAGTKDKSELLAKIEELGRQSCLEAITIQERFIEIRSILSSLVIASDPTLSKLFELFDITPEDFGEAAIFGRHRRVFTWVKGLPKVLGGFARRPHRLRQRVMNRAWTARPTPLFDQFSTDLTNFARHGQVGLLIGHEKEFQRLMGILARPTKPNALLVGEPGVGKTALVAHLAFRLVKDLVPPPIFDRRLISLNIGSLMANATLDIMAGRLKAISDEIVSAGNIILHIPDLEDLFKSGERGGLSAIDILLPIFHSDLFPVVAEVYSRDFKKSLEPRSDVLDLFEVVRVDEINKEEAVRFLVYDTLILERQFKIFVTFRAIKKAVELAHRYFRPKLLPASADNLLKQSLIETGRRGEKILGEETVIAVAEERSRIPIQRAGEAETQILLNLEKIIHQRLINQDQAVKAVAEALRQYRSGLVRKGGPIASFLFVGPTGVGKTELSKILAKIQFGSSEAMIRFDMSEYQEKQSISRFIGAAESGMASSLTDAVLQKPYSLVLLDEFEKAHPDILNLFLQVFDDGRLTDSLGRTVDFQNTIIIATSNAHSDFIKEKLEEGKPIEEIGDELKKKLTSIFRPELLNRFSDVIVFRNLNIEETQAIARILLDDLGQTLKDIQGVTLHINEAAVAKLAELGYSPIFGARPLRQVISGKIRSVLADKILRREIGRGNEIKVILEGERFEFKITA
jgi:ATP-dependent Clp protease ATP-binding subunit ClpC